MEQVREFFTPEVLSWLADFATLLGGVIAVLAAIAGFLAKYALLPWLEKKISIQALKSQKEIRGKVSSLKKDIQKFAEVAATTTKILADLESVKSAISDLTPKIEAVEPRLEKQRNEYEEKLSELRGNLRKMQSRILNAAAKIAQDGLDEPEKDE